MSFGGGGAVCPTCKKKAYALEAIQYDGVTYHKTCFKCKNCQRVISVGQVAKIQSDIYCKDCFKKMFKEHGGKYDQAFGHAAQWHQRHSVMDGKTPSPQPTSGSPLPPAEPLKEEPKKMTLEVPGAAPVAAPQPTKPAEVKVEAKKAEPEFKKPEPKEPKPIRLDVKVEEHKPADTKDASKILEEAKDERKKAEQARKETAELLAKIQEERKAMAALIVAPAAAPAAAAPAPAVEEKKEEPKVEVKPEEPKPAEEPKVEEKKPEEAAPAPAAEEPKKEEEKKEVPLVDA